MSLRNYETVFIVNPVLSEDQIKDTVNKFREYLKNHGAEIYHEETWGMRKMAYVVDGKSTGFYQLFEFKAEPTIVSGLEVEYKRDERLMRFLTVALDKHGVEFNENRRQGKFAKRPATAQ